MMNPYDKEKVPIILSNPGKSLPAQGELGVAAYENNEEFNLYAYLPGLKKEVLKVVWDGNGNTLTIEGKYETSTDPDQIAWHGKPFEFQRKLTLSGPVNSEKITATYKDGVLQVVLPKAEEAKPTPHPPVSFAGGGEVIRLGTWRNPYDEGKIVEELSKLFEAEQSRRAEINRQQSQQSREAEPQLHFEPLGPRAGSFFRALPVIRDSTSISRRALTQGNFQRSFVVMLCRAFSMISGGFLFGSSISHNSLWGSIIGTVVGIGAFALNEVTVRRVEG